MVVPGTYCVTAYMRFLATPISKVLSRYGCRIASSALRIRGCLRSIAERMTCPSRL